MTNRVIYVKGSFFLFFISFVMLNKWERLRGEVILEQFRIPVLFKKLVSDSSIH